MQVEEIQEKFLPLVGGTDDDQPRSPGLHVSHIIKDIMKEVEPERFKDRTGEEMPWALMEMGFVWEEVLSLGLISRYRKSKETIIYQPGEVMLMMDNTPCYMTPDGYHIEDDCIEEYKFTKSSARREIDEPFFAHWIMQTMAYCKAMDCTVSRFRVMFVNGDYRESRNPIVRVWNVTFTERELKENWEMLTNHARSKGWLTN